MENQKEDQMGNEPDAGICWDYVRGLGNRDTTPLMENQMDKNMEDMMETGVF